MLIETMDNQLSLDVFDFSLINTTAYDQSGNPVFQEQMIDDFLTLQANEPVQITREINTESISGTVYQREQPQPKNVSYGFQPEILDYTKSFAITTKYWAQIEKSMDTLAMLPCACGDHGSNSQTSTSIFESQFSFSSESTFSSETTEKHHEHCSHCGECLVDGICPKCGHGH